MIKLSKILKEFNNVSGTPVFEFNTQIYIPLQVTKIPSVINKPNVVKTVFIELNYSYIYNYVRKVLTNIIQKNLKSSNIKFNPSKNISPWLFPYAIIKSGDWRSSQYFNTEDVELLKMIFPDKFQCILSGKVYKYENGYKIVYNWNDKSKFEQSLNQFIKNKSDSKVTVWGTWKVNFPEYFTI